MRSSGCAALSAFLGDVLVGLAEEPDVLHDVDAVLLVDRIELLGVQLLASHDVPEGVPVGDHASAVHDGYGLDVPGVLRVDLGDQGSRDLRRGVLQEMGVDQGRCQHGVIF